MSNAEPVGEKHPVVSKNILRRVGREVVWELLFVGVCVALALGLNIKVTLAVVLLCLKFAIGDFVTALIVLRHDPSRAHGLGLALLFLATGMARASQFAFIAVFVSATLFVPIFAGKGMGNIAAVGLGVGFCCAYAFLVSIFPLTVAALLVARTNGIKLMFAAQLTKLRRAAESDRHKIRLEVERSLEVLAIASGISVAMCIISSLFFVAPQGNVAGACLVIFAFVSPFVWIVFFHASVNPKVKEIDLS